MSGVSAIRYLLAASTPLTAVVPATRIQAGVLPVGVALPAVLVTQISSVPVNLIKTNAPYRTHIDRVQVTALVKATNGAPGGAGYPGLKALLRLVLAACQSQRGVVNGVNVISIQPDTEGPDVYDGVDLLHSGSRDFIVRWTAPT